MIRLKIKNKKHESERALLSLHVDKKNESETKVEECFKIHCAHSIYTYKAIAPKSIMLTLFTLTRQLHNYYFNGQRRFSING